MAARGGREALAAVRTLRMTGRANAGPGREAIVRREIARPGRIRTEFVFQGTTGVYVWDGSAGWRVSPLDGSLEAEPLPAEAGRPLRRAGRLRGPARRLEGQGPRGGARGQRRRCPAAAAHKLKVTLKSGVVRHIWVDAKTGLVVRTESTRKLRGHEVTLETVYGDYRETGGVRFARSIETGVRGRPQRLRIVVETVEMNPALDDSRFSLPR